MKRSKPVLQFSPTAWAKLLFMRDMTDNEVGGFGVTGVDDLLFVKDFVLIKQTVSSVTVSFDDEAVADYFEDQVALGRKPEQFARIWLHSHPGMSPEPSGTDEATFSRVFGRSQWAVMFIISSNGETYARLRFNCGPGGEIKIPVIVDYTAEFESSDFTNWEKLYKDTVEEEVFLPARKSIAKTKCKKKAEVFGSSEENGFNDMMSEEFFYELEQMHPLERQEFMQELAYRSEFWDEYDQEVQYE